MNPRFDLVLSYWIFVWFILYIYDIVPYSPKLALVLALLIEVVVFGLMLLNGISKHFIGVFIIIQILLKIIPLYILRNETIDYLPQLFYMGVLLILYALWLLSNKQNAIDYFTNQMQGLYQGKSTTPAISIIYPYLMKFLEK
jgi:hypothetical protein